MQHAKRQFTDGYSLMTDLLKPQPGEVVLDLGCGTGRLTAELASRVGTTGKVLGVDPNESKIAVAQRTNSDSGVANMSFLY